MNLGMGVMLNMLSGSQDRTVETLRSAFGKIIAGADISENVLRVRFDDGSGIEMWDDGQSCCESRYMRTDDDLAELNGAVLKNVEVRDAPSIDDDGEHHDVQFLLLVTDRGVTTFSNHNEHNGYYGGFSIAAKPLKDSQ